MVIGIAAALAGVVWTLQGLGYVGGSFMSGATVWAVIGPVVALAGLALIVLGLRTPPPRALITIRHKSAAELLRNAKPTPYCIR